MTNFNINGIVYNVYEHDLLESGVNPQIYDLQRSYQTPEAGDYFGSGEKCYDHMMTKPLVKTFGSQGLVETINGLDHIEGSANDGIERASHNYAYDEEHIIWDEDSPGYDFLHREGASHVEESSSSTSLIIRYFKFKMI